MANNPFVIQSPSYGSGLAALGAGLGQLGQQYRQEERRDEAMAQQQQQQDRLMAAQQKAKDIIASGGGPRELAMLSIENPEIGRSLMASMTFRDEASKQNLMDTYQSIVSGGDVEQALVKRANYLQDQGIDNTDTLDEIEQYRANPEGYLEQKQNQYALIDKNYAKTLVQGGDKSEPFEQGKGVMVGYSFNPNTGVYEKQVDIDSADIKPTANMQDLQEYKRLKNANDPDAKAFGQKVGLVGPDGKELSVHLQKRLSTSTDNAIKSESNAESYDGLAAQFDTADVGGGLFQGSWGESMKDITGMQDAKTDLRKKYNAIRGSQVVNNLPPGAASDTDIKLALSGFPTDNATGKQISSFLRGLAKIERQKAAFENFKANYISKTGNERGMINAWKYENSKKTEAASSPLSDEELLKKYGG